MHTSASTRTAQVRGERQCGRLAIADLETCLYTPSESQAIRSTHTHTHHPTTGPTPGADQDAVADRNPSSGIAATTEEPDAWQ